MATEEELDIIIKAKNLAQQALEDMIKDLKGIGSQAKKSSRLLSGFRTAVNKIKTSVFSLRGAFAALGLGFVAKSFIEAASTAEQYRVRLKVLMGDVKEANGLFKDMSEFASGVSFEYEQIMGSATALAGVMKGGREEIKQWMPMISDLAATAGMGIEETTSQVIRMYSAGAASADMFRERGILAMLGFQAGVSVSAEQTRKKLIEAWEDPASKFRDASLLLSHTWGGMLSMMSDVWFQFRNMVMEAGVFDYIKGALDLLLERIRTLKEQGKLDKWAESMAEKVIGAFGIMIKTVYVMKDVLKGLKLTFMGVKLVGITLAEAFWSIKSVLSDVSLFIKKFFDDAVYEAKVLWTKFQNIFRMRNLEIPVKVEPESTEAYKELDKQIKAQADKYRQAGIELSQAIQDLASGPSSLAKADKLLDSIRQKAKEAADAFKEASGRVKAPVEAKGPSPLAQLASDLNKVKELGKTYLTELNYSLDRGGVSLEKYYAERERLVEEQYQKEIEYLNKKIELEEKDDKKQALRDKLFAAEQAHERELIKLKNEKIKKEKEYNDKRIEAEQIISNIQNRVLNQRAGTLSETFAKELRDLDNRQQEEMKNIREMTKVIQDESKKRMLIKDAETAHIQEKNQLLLDQERRLHEFRLQMASETAGGLATVFSDLYEITGKKTKEFFYLSKAAAIAEAIINNSLAITKAMAQGGIWGIGQAALIAAKGALEIAKISAQTMSEGGFVMGTSPNSKADDKLIAGTSGEFMQPVNAVRYYGGRIMEGIRQMAFPKEIFSGFKVPSTRGPSGFALASGGSVPSNGAPASQQGREVVFANFYDMNEFLNFLGTAKARGAIINILAQEKNALRRLIT